MNKLFINIVLTLILISKGTEGIVKIIICDSIVTSIDILEILENPQCL